MLKLKWCATYTFQPMPELHVLQAYCFYDIRVYIAFSQRPVCRYAQMCVHPKQCVHAYVFP